jgi:uncharacterized membrane protein
MTNNENINVEYINKLVNEGVTLNKLSDDSPDIKHFLFEQQDKGRSIGMKIADAVSAFCGSWPFIILSNLAIIAWICLNNILDNEAFDQYPYILLNLALASLAVLQAPLILMSQNRYADKEKRRNENEYLISLISELNVKDLDKKFDEVIIKQMNVVIEIENKQRDHINQLDKKIESALQAKKQN